jgi:hypothetical protein
MFQKVNSFKSSILKDLSEKVSILYPNIDDVSNPCNCREKGITNKDFLSTFGNTGQQLRDLKSKKKDIIMSLEWMINETNCSIAKGCMANFFICLSLTLSKHR